MAVPGFDGSWSSALSAVMARLGAGPRTGGGYPRINNLEASGLILFARAVASEAAKRGKPIVFDWYAYALPALGWNKSGDRFLLDVPQQQREYPAAGRLWGDLAIVARQLDEDNIPFSPVRDVTGTIATFRELARDTFARMQAESPADAAATMRAPKAPPYIQARPGLVSPVEAEDDDELDIQPSKKKPKPQPKPESGAGAGILLLLAVLALSQD